jgi:tetratricopeptide (TPR) repeat protein
MKAYHAQEYDIAIVSLNELLVLTPDSPEVLFSLGRAYQGKEQLEDAYQYYNRVWKINPDNKPNNACIAQCVAESARDNSFSSENKKAEFKNAIEYFKQAFGDPRVSESALNNNIGYCYLALRDFDSAAQYFDAALAADPDQSITHHHLVVLNRLRAKNSPDLFDRQVLENAMMYADGEPETYFEAANGYAFLLRHIKDEHERKIALQQCLEGCRKAIACGLSPDRLNMVANNLKMVKDLASDSAEMEELEKLQLQTVSARIVGEFDPLIDPVVEQPTFLSEQSTASLEGDR